jgi:two-component system, LytTR family, response regulator
METSVLVLKTSTGPLFIDTRTIIRIEASSNYCRIYFDNGKTVVIAKLLKWFEEKLPHESFVRMHRSHLVNHFFLQPNQLIGKGIVLINGDYIRLSRRRRKNILNQLQAA